MNSPSTLPTSLELIAAVVQIDLDPVYAYAANYAGRTALAQDEDPVYLRALPRCLDMLQQAGLRATFFAVGQDLECQRHRDALSDALSQGHEVASHSQHHLLGLSAKDPETVRREICDAHDAIHTALGIQPIGFRAPGWAVSGEILRTLRELGYLYDASVLPSWFGWVENAALKILSRGRAPAGQGDWRVAFAPAEPYFPRLTAPWRRDSQRDLVEVPAGVMPFSRFPLRATLQLTAGEGLVRRSAKGLGARPLIYVFHGLDFLGSEEVDPRARSQPTANLPLTRKKEFCERIFSVMAAGRSPQTTAQLAAHLLDGDEPPH